MKYDERYAYIHESQAVRMKSPGTYDNLDCPRKKNFNQKQVFISVEKRFNLPPSDTPGPGAYIDKEEDLVETYSGTLIRNLSLRNMDYLPPIDSTRSISSTSPLKESSQT
jgi:hypothetical protein